MKHHTRCLVVLGLYAVSLVCLVDCRPVTADLTDSIPATTEMFSESVSEALSSEESSPAASTSMWPDTTKGSSVEIDTAEPSTTETDLTEPLVSDPSAAAPSAAAPPTSEPSTTASHVAEPTISEPAATTPPTTAPPITEPSDPEIPSSESPPPGLTLDREKSQQAFQLQNDLLAQNGIPLLQWSEALYDIAARRAVEISSEYSHAGCPDWIGENILMGTISPEMTVQIWYDSSGHRQNMLAGWTYGAVANYGTYWAAVFAMAETP